MKEILLTTINAKWIHPSLALRLLKANLGELEDRCEIIEFSLRQPLAEKIKALSAVRPRILGISVSIWNHTATLELLKELKKIWTQERTKTDHEAIDNACKQQPLFTAHCSLFPVIVLGGPEVSHLPPNAEIFQYADYVIRGEGEIAFRELCEKILASERLMPAAKDEKQKKYPTQFIEAQDVDLSRIKSAYHLYTDEDIAKKLIYVEASRGCPFNCEFCLSGTFSKNPRAEAQRRGEGKEGLRIRDFSLEQFFNEMNTLISRGVKTFKFLDRSFNTNIKRAIQIMEFFLEKIEERKRQGGPELVIHFEMVPSLFPPELRETIARFLPAPAGSLARRQSCAGSLRLEIGIQTLNPDAAARIGRKCDPEKELETLRFLREKTNAILHVDLIAGLPGEDLASFGRGFDKLAAVISAPAAAAVTAATEIQVGILKLLPGAPITRHNDAFGMRYSPLPPYEVEETSAMSAEDIRRIKNFARFWEILVNRALLDISNWSSEGIFDKFMGLSDSLYANFGRNWGIDKAELLEFLNRNAYIEAR